MMKSMAIRIQACNFCKMIGLWGLFTAMTKMKKILEKQKLKQIYKSNKIELYYFHYFIL